jgi:serine/threonine protein kinase
VSRATQSDLPQHAASSSSSTSSIRFKGMPVRYKKGEQLGSGSSGVVYQILDLETGELLAVKEVKRQDLIETVEKEAQLMSSLEEHPHIIRYRGMRKEQTRPFSGPSELTLHIFTEWLAGGSVSQLIKSYGPLEEGAARRYTLQILQGLAFLHENRVVHRDVKGSNILIGSNGNVKLGDLGSSRVLASTTSSAGSGPPMAQEVAMSFKGTCFWCPPEVIRMEGHSFSADLYSLGCTVLEMMNGVPPFSEEVEGPLQALMLIASISSEAELSKRLRPPPSSSALCADFVRLCTRLDPSQRPSAQALLQHPWLVSDSPSSMSLTDKSRPTPPKSQHPGRSPLFQ